MLNIGFIGFGNMAQAIASGLLALGKYQIMAASPSQKPGQNEDGILRFADNSMVAKQADLLILAVKPHQAEAVLAEICPTLREDALLISVAAGLSLSWLQKQCRTQQAIIRSMPNTPTAVKQGVTALIANADCNSQQKQSADDIFSLLGRTVWLDKEEEMDAITALSGSGPAYVFKFMEAMSDAAVKLGIEPALAQSLSLDTVNGACALARETGLPPATLRQNVTSPGGVTAAALNVLGKGALDGLLLETMSAAKARSEAMKK